MIETKMVLLNTAIRQGLIIERKIYYCAVCAAQLAPILHKWEDLEETHYYYPVCEKLLARDF